MDRKEFLVKMGKGAAVATFAFCVGCAAKDGDIPTAPSGVDFTLDLTQTPNQALNNVGGSIINNGIMIARASTTSVVAVSSACTHEGTTIDFQLNNNRFYCSNHGSTFALNGNVTNGPAAKALISYKTTLSGNSLRIFS